MEEEPKADERAEVAADVDVLERIKLEQLLARGEGLGGIEVVDRLELVVHKDAVRVRVEAEVVDPYEVAGDVALHLERALAEHEEAVDARAEGDADDVVRRDRADEAHEPLGRDERAEERGEEDAKAVEPSERHDTHGGEDGDERQAGQRAEEVGGGPRADAVRPVGPLAQEGGALLCTCTMSVRSCIHGWSV